MEPLLPTFSDPDVQNALPTLQVSLSRVGVTGSRRSCASATTTAARTSSPPGWTASSTSGPLQKGAHMSRFEEVVNEAIGEVVLGTSVFRAEVLAERIAALVRERQGAARAEVHIAARYPEHKPAPVSGITTQEIYTLHGAAVASARGTRRSIGVAATGMTACPCAQQLVAGRARERLADDGFSEDEIARILDAVPSPRTTSAASGRCTSGCPSTPTSSSTRGSSWPSSRSRCPARSTSS
jgi:GTP cyclohydrolase I/GTP cyclohydrolase-4